MLTSRRKLFVFSLVASFGSAIGAYAFEPEANRDDQNRSHQEKTRAQKSQADRVVSDDSGNEFMEEVPDKKAQVKQADQPIKIDLGNVGVSVDSNGKIIPLLNRGGPAVVPFSNQFEQSVEPIAPYGYGYGPAPYPINPYAFSRPGWQQYGRYPYGQPGFRQLGPYVQHEYSFQQRTTYFGTTYFAEGQPWFAPPAPPPINEPSGSTAIDPFF